jgi:hypothetical protein
MQRDSYLTILRFLKERHMSSRILRPSTLGMEFNELNKGAHYLQEHGLANFRGIIESHDPVIHIDLVGGDVENQLSGSITVKGYDYMEQDGGLTSELNIQVIRLHADTIRDLIEAKILNNEDISTEKKSKLLTSLRDMPEEAMRQLTQKLIGYGLDQAPSAWGAIIKSLT